MNCKNIHHEEIVLNKLFNQKDYNGLNKEVLFKIVIDSYSDFNSRYSRSNKDFNCFKHTFVEPFLKNLQTYAPLNDDNHIPYIKAIFKHVINGIEWIREEELGLWFHKTAEISESTSIILAHDQIKQICDDLFYLDSIGKSKPSLNYLEEIRKFVINDQQ